MIYYLAGGTKSGKSMLAQRIARAMPGPHYYVATMRPADAEDDARIAKHLADRAGWGFLTAEQPEHICGLLDTCDRDGAFLMDSVTALLSNEMFATDGTIDLTAPARVEQELLQLAAGVKNIVIVSDFIFTDGVCYDELTEAFRAGLGHIGCAVAEIADGVAELCAGVPVWYKGGWME